MSTAAGNIDTHSITVDVVKGNTTQISHGRVSRAMTDANYTYPTADCRDNAILEVTGTLTADRDVILPLNDGAIVYVCNGTTGGHATTFKATGQTGVSVPAGGRRTLYCNATDWVDANA